MEPRNTLQFDAFWQWLARHPNCIVRAGTPEAVLYDDEDLHWHFGQEEDRILLIQLVRGKRLVGELLVEAEQVAYVEEVPSDTPEEHLFELIAENERDRFAPYFFVLAHGLDTEEPESSRHVH